jgi:intracellular sulfur oxidation DsrE/DsrF family protein
MLKVILHLDHPASVTATGTSGMPLVAEYIEQTRSADPNAAIVVVATGCGIWELSSKGVEVYAHADPVDVIGTWTKVGVGFVACQDAVRRHGGTLHPNVRIVPFGIALIAELQEEGYRYIKVASVRH